MTAGDTTRCSSPGAGGSIGEEGGNDTVAVQGSDRDEVEDAEDDADEDDGAEVEAQVITGVPAAVDEAVDDVDVEGRQPGHEPELEGEASDGGDSEVGERAGAGDEGEGRLRIARGARIHLHRLAPAESDHEQEERAGRVQVGQRVQRYAAAAAGKAVAQEIGDVGVGELVEGDACYKGAGEGAEQDDRGKRIDFEKV